MLKGYSNHATQQKKGAVPLTEVKMQLLLQSIAIKCSNSKTDYLQDERLLPLEDGMMHVSI